MFPLTDWKIILDATLAGNPAGRKALNSLCTTYRPPVVSFLRARGWGVPEAEDLAQQLFLKLCESRGWKKADRAKGPFRTFLLTILQHIICNNLDQRDTLKRGGGAPVMSLEWLGDETGWEPSTSDLEPSEEFDREWALNTLRAAYSRVEGRWIKLGKKQKFSIYSQFLPGSQRPPEYSEAAKQLKIAETTARKAVERLRDELQQSLRRELAATAGPEGDVDAEMRYLGEVLARPGMNYHLGKASPDSSQP